MSITDEPTAQLPIWSWAMNTCSASTARTSVVWAKNRATVKTRLSLPRQVRQGVHVCMYVQFLRHVRLWQKFEMLKEILWAELGLLTSSSGLDYKPNPFKEKDMACMPKFTQPLVDRSVVAGYSTAISCAVRGFPKVNWHVKKASEETDNTNFISKCIANN